MKDNLISFFCANSSTFITVILGLIVWFMKRIFLEYKEEEKRKEELYDYLLCTYKALVGDLQDSKIKTVCLAEIDKKCDVEKCFSVLDLSNEDKVIIRMWKQYIEHIKNCYFEDEIKEIVNINIFKDKETRVLNKKKIFEKLPFIIKKLKS